MAEVNKRQQETANLYKESLVKNGSTFEIPATAVADPPEKTPAKETVTETKDENKGKVAATENASEKDKGAVENQPTIDAEAAFRKRLKEELGVDLEDAKTKLSQKPLTEEDKKRQEQNAQKAVMDEYLSIEGNTIDGYNKVQAEVAKPDMELVRNRFMEENKADLEGLTDEEKEIEFKDTYGLDGDKVTAKGVKLAEKKIAKEAKSIRDELLNPIKNAETSFASKATKKENSTKWERSVDDFIKTDGEALRTITYEDEKHGKVETKVPDEVFNEVFGMIKDTGKFATYLQNPDGTTNKKKLAEVLIKAAMFDKHPKIVAEAAYGKGVNDAKANFPPAPDFSNVGKQDTGVAEATDLQKKANEHNKSRLNKR